MKYLITIGLLLTGFLVHAQCGLDQTYVITDLDNNQADTTNVKILVNGAVHNDLATAPQGVCGVKLKFKHPFMKELFIELISPSGKKVILTGGDIVPTNTQLITWDVTFVPCAATPAPDYGFEPIWENDQTWQNLTTYTGQYHPHKGCLEDFNTGSVDGVWTLRCIDFEDGGQGSLLNAKIIFCMDEGIACGPCILNPGLIVNEDIETCVGSPELTFDLDKDFQKGIYDTVIYDYVNVVFNGDTLVDYIQDVDFTGYLPGTYTICGLQVSKHQSSILPPVGSLYNHEDLNNYFFKLGACAQVGDDCMQVIINQPSPPTELVRYLCKGDTVIIDGMKYTEEGIYDITIKSEICDSLIKLDLRSVDIKALIEAEKDSIGCVNSEVSLQGSFESNTAGDISYHWFSGDGAFNGDADSSAIIAVKHGTYYLELTVQSQDYSCKDTTSIYIKADISIPTLTFMGDTILNCHIDTSEIVPQISIPVQTVKWISKNGSPFVNSGQGIKVWEPDTYYIEVIAVGGCIITDSITIGIDKVYPLVHFNHGSINCKDTVITITTILDIQGGYSFLWDNVDDLFRDTQNPEVSRGGEYYVTVTNNQNGCSVQSSVIIPEDKMSPLILDVVIDTLNCKRRTVKPLLMPNNDIGAYLWTGPGLNSTLVSPDITQSGEYKVKITSSKNYCIATKTFDVFGDFVVPEILVEADSITCYVDSVQLITTSNIRLTKFRWTGPGFNESQILSPYVKKGGIYILEAEGSNGCKSIVQIEVINSRYKPEIIINNDTIKCGTESIELSISPDLPLRSYNWSGPGLLTNNNSNPLINKPGLYLVTVTNDITGCIYETEIYIADGRIFSKPIIQVPSLDCAHDSVRVTLSNKDIQSVVFTGDSFYSTEVSPYIHNAGKYYISFTNINNCVTLDSFQVKIDTIKPIISADFDLFKCNQDSVIIEGVSNIRGTTFEWSGPDGFIKSGGYIYVYKGGAFNVVGKAPNGCKIDYSFELGYDTIPPVFHILPPDTLTCLRSVITLKTDFLQGQGSIVWQPGDIEQFEIEVRQPGVYVATAIGFNQCESRDSVQVEERKTLPDFEVTATIINCKDWTSRIEITPLTDYETIVWDNINNPDEINDGKFIVITSYSGIYNFTVTNDEGCVTNGSIEVKSDTIPPLIKEIYTDTLDCSRPRIDIGVFTEDDIIEYLWNGPQIYDLITESGILNISEEGKYYLKITSSNFCSSSVVFDIIKDDNLPVYSLFGDTLTCEKGKVTIGINADDPNLEFLWMGPGGFLSTQKHPKVFSSGNYIINITGKNGCVVQDSIFIYEIINNPHLSIPDTLFLPCDLSNIVLEVTSESELERFYWVYPNNDIFYIESPKTNIPGKYSIQAGDKYGCLSEVVYFDVVLDQTIPKVTMKIDTITCKNPLATLNAESDYKYISYEWKSPSGKTGTESQFMTPEGGDFLLITSNASGCKDTIHFQVQVDTLKPFIAVEYLGEILCENANVVLDASKSNQGKPFTVLWSTQDGHISQYISDYAIQVDMVGNYALLVTDLRNGCVNDDIIKVEETPSNFTLLDLTITPPYCDQVQNGTVKINELNGTPPYIIVFNGQDVGDQTYFDQLKAGMYTLFVTDANGCTQQKLVVVPRNESLKIVLESEMVIYFGDSVLIQPQINGAIFGDHSLDWYVRDSLICKDCPELKVSPFNNTVYTIVHTIDGLCKEETTILIRVNRNLNSAVPNIFNPNSSQGNERYYIPQTRGIVNIKRMLIFNRWAENVYSAYDIPPGVKETGWDGTFRGKECNPGVYIIIVDFQLVDGRLWTYKGDLTLIR